jgi:hypothetical protein
MANAWLAHVKKTMRSHKGMKFGQVLKMAKKTYHKGKKHGGADGDEMPEVKPEVKAEEGGRRRRSSRRTRRHRRR